MDVNMVFVPSLGRTITETDLHISILHAFQDIGPTKDQNDAITLFLTGHDVLAEQY